MKFETDLLLHLINNDYSLLETEQFKRTGLKHFLKTCSANRLLYMVCRLLHEEQLAILSEGEGTYIKRILEEGDLRIKRYQKTMIFLDDVFKKKSIEWLLIKTDKDIPYVVNDIDILVKDADFELAKRLISTASGRIISDKLPEQIHYALDELCKIDIHRSFYQLNTPYVDAETLWKTPVNKEFEGVHYRTPSPTHEACMIILNTLYGCFHISFLDCLYFKKNTASIDFEEIRFQSDKYGWMNGFLTYIATLRNIFSILFPENEWESFLPKKNCTLYKKIKPDQLQLPYIFTFVEIMNIFKERGYRIRGQDCFMLAYYLYARFRYYLTNGARVPIHAHWFKF